MGCECPSRETFDIYPLESGSKCGITVEIVKANIPQTDCWIKVTAPWGVVVEEEHVYVGDAKVYYDNDEYEYIGVLFSQVDADWKYRFEVCYRYKYCETGCEVTCQTGCQVSCKLGCEVTCETGCEVSCETGCEVSCETGCEVSCETGCEVSCETAAEVPTCDQLVKVVDPALNPIEGAAVVVPISATESAICYTDANGFCDITALTIGSIYTACASKADYEHYGDDGCKLFTACTTPIAVILTLHKPCAQGFLVSDQDNNPVEGATVTVTPVDKTCTTNADGWCEVTGLSEGLSYDAAATKSGYECFGSECRQDNFTCVPYSSLPLKIREIVVPKDTIICDFDILDPAGENVVTDLYAGVQYWVRAWLCKVEGGGCAEILKGCDSGCEIAGEDLKLFLLGQAASEASGTTNENGYTAFPWTPSEDIGSVEGLDNSIRVEFVGSAGYNSSETTWKAVTVKLLSYKINITVKDENDNPIEGAYVDIDKYVAGVWGEKRCQDVAIYKGECVTDEFKGDADNIKTDANGEASFGLPELPGGIPNKYGFRVGKQGYLNVDSHEDWTERQETDPQPAPQGGTYNFEFSLTFITAEDKFTVLGKPGMKAACEEVKEYLGMWVREPWYFAVSKEIPASGEAEFTTADGLVEGTHYAVYTSLLPIPFVPWIYLDYEVYEFRGRRVITPGMGAVVDVMCSFFGVEVGTKECSEFVVEFVDSIFVANTISIITAHYNLITGEHQEPEALDYLFLPIVLIGSVTPIPIGKIWKSFVGKLRKHGTVSETVVKWLFKHGDEMTEVGVYGDEVRLKRFTDLIDDAMTHPEGSPEMLKCLDDATIWMKDTIAKPGVSDDAALKIYGDWLAELNTRLQLAKSVTSGDDVIQLSGLRAVGKKLYKKVFDKLGKTKKGLKAHSAPVEVEGQLYDLSSITITEGEVGEQIARHLVLHTSGLMGWLGRHKLAVGIAAGWIAVMGPWYTADNVCFIVYLLRKWGIIPEGWGTQWDDAVARRESAFFALKDTPCVTYYQVQYATALDTMKTLIDGASPIPTDKVEKARYYLSVVYGFDIGDPHEALLEQMKTDFNAWTYRYFSLTQACHDAVKPTWTIDVPKHPELIENVKVEKVVDGDTIDVWSEDLEWPFGETMRVRLLGIDTIEGSEYAYRIRRQTDFGGQTGAIDEWWGDKDFFDAVKLWMTQHVKGHLVNLRSDENRRYDGYRRFLAVPIMVSDGKDIGEEELKLGHGPVRFYLPNKVVDVERQAKYLAAESIAKGAELGVWKLKLTCSCFFGEATYTLNDEAMLYYTNAPAGSVFKLIKPDGGTFKTWLVEGNGNEKKKLDLVGTWKLTLNGIDCSAEDTAVVSACPTPIADFDVTPSTSIVEGTTVSFLDASTSGGTVPINKWLWNFGAGEGTSALKNPSHTYNTPGKFTASLVVTNECLNPSTPKTVEITVKEEPVPPPPKGDLTIEVYESRDFATAVGLPVDEIFVDGTKVASGTNAHTVKDLLVSANPHVVRILFKTTPHTCYVDKLDECFDTCEFGINIVKDVVTTIRVCPARGCLFLSDPSGASIYIKPVDAPSKDYEEISASYVLPLGTYSVRFSGLSGYGALEAVISVRKDKVICESVTTASGHCYTDPTKVVRPGLLVSGFLLKAYLPEAVTKTVTFESVPTGATVTVID